MTDPEIRRFGYFTAKSDGTMDFMVHSTVANAKVLKEFYDVIRVVWRLQPLVIALQIVENNHHELLESLDTYRSFLDELRTPHIVPMAAALKGIVLAAQRITNFLSGASAFLTQTETQLKTAHGEESPEFVAWNERRRDLHATSFAYRFLYELRNFSQHCGLPLSSLNVAGKRPSEDVPMVFNAGVLIVRDGLLAPRYDWQKTLAAEIKNQPAQFDLLPLTHEYLRHLQAICLEAFQLENMRLVDCARYFDAVKRTFQVPSGAVPVIFIGESASSGSPPRNYEMMPMEQLGWLLRKYDELLNLLEPNATAEPTPHVLHESEKDSKK